MASVVVLPTNTPNQLPLIEPVELFVTLPPPARSAPAPLVPMALMLPLLVSVPALVVSDPPLRTVMLAVAPLVTVSVVRALPAPATVI